MPIRIVSNEFTDIFGNDLTFYQANAGDKIIQTVVIEDLIQVTETIDKSIQVDFIDGKLQLLGSSWLEEGFRLNDSITIETYQSGSLVTSTSKTITYIDDNWIRLNSTLTYFNETLYTIRVKTSRYHNDLELKFNHILNSATSGTQSLIDQEETKVIFNNIDALSVSGSVNGSLVGKQSGQYLISSVLTRNTDAYDSRVYTLVNTFIQSGVYDSTWFDFGDCLKLALEYRFYSLPNETAYPTILKWSEEANTGWFNEAYNVSVIDSELRQGITSIDYSSPTTTDIVIKTSSTNFQIGACYVSIDTNYYKNKVSNQNSLSLLLDSYSALSTTTYSSDGGLYEITVNSITTVGLNTTINITFTPLTGFETLISSFDDGNRLFYIWIKAGNVNHLVFNSQLTKTISTTRDLTLYEVSGYFKHGENIDTPITSFSSLLKANKEDDLAFYSGFYNTELFTNLSYFKISLIAYNSVTTESFELQSMSYDLTTVQLNSSGDLILNETKSILNNLGANNKKKYSYLKYDNANNIFIIYYPFLLDWKYWNTLSTASNDFYPNQNNDWLNYNTGNWSLKTNLSLVTKDSINYTKNVDLPIYDYDTEPLINTSITLLKSNGSNALALFNGEQMYIKALHEHIGIDYTSAWGEITIENFETNQRWNISTIVPFDFNTSNPMSPLSGNYASISKNIATQTTEIVCKLDTTKLQILGNSNKFKITSKIYLSDPIQNVAFVFQNDAFIGSQENNKLIIQSVQ